MNEVRIPIADVWVQSLELMCPLARSWEETRLMISSIACTKDRPKILKLLRPQRFSRYHIRRVGNLALDNKNR